MTIYFKDLCWKTYNSVTASKRATKPCEQFVLVWKMEADEHTCLEIEISHWLFGRCVHTVNRIPLLFIGEGIKLYLCFYPSNKSIYPWESWCIKCIYCVLFIVCVQYWLLALAFYDFLQFLRSPYFPQTSSFPPLERMESLTNMFGRLIPLYSQCGFNSPQTRRQQLQLGCMYLRFPSGGEEGAQSKQTCTVSPTRMFTLDPDPNSRPPADHLN